MRISVFTPVLMLVDVQPALAQSVPEADARRIIEEIQSSYIQTNVPDQTSFSRFLQRDLDAYFGTRGFREPLVSFELLRRAATQSGISYPRFYLWVRVRSADGRSTSGAVRVSAIGRKRFEVTDFLSATEIMADPGRVGAIFPALLVQAIMERASSQASRTT